jgi:cytochrome c-type biogenesis protein CcmE
MRKKIVVASVVLAGAVGYLAYAGLQAGQSYYLAVDEFLADGRYATQRVRVHGRVGEQAPAARTQPAVLRFDLVGQTGKLPVVYRGVVPDMFKPGGEVVVEGTRSEAGDFLADRLLTKCASKYEARRGQAGRPQ